MFKNRLMLILKNMQTSLLNNLLELEQGVKMNKFKTISIMMHMWTNNTIVICILIYIILKKICIMRYLMQKIMLHIGMVRLGRCLYDIKELK